MTQVFADAYFWIALLLKRDHAHRKAVWFAQHLQHQLLTSEWVLMEASDAVAASPMRVPQSVYRSSANRA
jgi:predicted nucleic acid-binding protein